MVETADLARSWRYQLVFAPTAAIKEIYPSLFCFENPPRLCCYPLILCSTPPSDYLQPYYTDQYISQLSVYPHPRSHTFTSCLASSNLITVEHTTEWPYYALMMLQRSACRHSDKHFYIFITSPAQTSCLLSLLLSPAPRSSAVKKLHLHSHHIWHKCVARAAESNTSHWVHDMGWSCKSFAVSHQAGVPSDVHSLTYVRWSQRHWNA